MLSWKEDRWHLDDQPIHAGSRVEVRWPDGTYQAARLESSNQGQRLSLHFFHHGYQLCITDVQCDTGLDLRWPA